VACVAHGPPRAAREVGVTRLLCAFALGVLLLGLAPSARAAEALGGIAGKVTEAGSDVPVAVLQGRTAIAQIKLDSAGRKLLRDHGRLKVELALVSPGIRQDESVVLVERKASRNH
jgi:hypothetical protein